MELMGGKGDEEEGGREVGTRKGEEEDFTLKRRLQGGWREEKDGEKEMLLTSTCKTHS